ncbi:Zinc ABC transporter, substrate-binding protein ZnuA [hydrothermal vent metagenome]|uniref:Zinc ABC transporter, substrate-binding protein ZnuA n=1 Tax=hydrothermal vent metagenome TaxID=652676 RepID=A0A3B1B1J0_9ZZZZ
MRRQLTDIKQQTQRLQQTDEQQLNALEQRLEELESQSNTGIMAVTSPAIPTVSTTTNNSGLQIGLSGLFAVGGSSVDNSALANLQGGAHDPDQNGFTVQSLTNGTRDPHFASAKRSMIRKVFCTDLLLLIGADMEIGWLPPLLQSARNVQAQPGNPGYLDLSRGIPLRGKISGPVSRAMGDVHARGNPHYWLDPRNGIRMAQAIASRLSELDPTHKDNYQQRFKSIRTIISPPSAVIFNLVPMLCVGTRFPPPSPSGTGLG